MFVCFLNKPVQTSPHLPQLERAKQHCYAVKLQKRFVDYKTSPDFSISKIILD